MNTLILYDSQFGNTEKIAHAIAKGVANPKVVSVNNADLKDIAQAELVIFGSPTQGGQATKAVQSLLQNLSISSLKNKKVAAFDTRFKAEKLGFALRLLVKTIGYAAPKIASALEKKGAKLIVPPEGFIVTGKEGPLADGELERAENWLK